MIQIKKLNDLPFSQIHAAFIDAFSNYQEPFELSEQQLEYMLTRRGYNSDLSYGAFYEKQLVGFILNGVREWNNKLTAYDTGTGTIKAFQGKGIAGKLFRFSIPLLKEERIQQYLLEVIKTNDKAINLYKKSGFSINNIFDYYVFNKKQIVISSNNISPKIELAKVKQPRFDLYSSLQDFPPSWQNANASMEKILPYLTIIEATYNQELVGYGIIENHTGDIPQLSVNINYRRQGIGSLLLEELVKYSEKDEIRIINIPGKNDPFKKFLESFQLQQGKGQFEMMLEL